MSEHEMLDPMPVPLQWNTPLDVEGSTIELPERTYILFHASLLPDDAAKVLAAIDDALLRKPNQCGAVLFTTKIPACTAQIGKVVERSPYVGTSKQGSDE